MTPVQRIWHELPGGRSMTGWTDQQIVHDLRRFREEAERTALEGVAFWQAAHGTDRARERRLLADDISGLRDARDRYHRAWTAFCAGRRKENQKDHAP